MGSRAGIPNKNKSFLLKRLQDMYGEDFHPIIKIAQNCVELQQNVDDIEIPEVNEESSDEGKEKAVEAKKSKASAIRLANNEWSRIAEYTEPKLKSIDHTGDIDQTLTIVRKEYKPSK